jgi:hypothetical protein
LWQQEIEHEGNIRIGSDGGVLGSGHFIGERWMPSADRVVLLSKRH